MPLIQLLGKSLKIFFTKLSWQIQSEQRALMIIQSDQLKRFEEEIKLNKESLKLKNKNKVSYKLAGKNVIDQIVKPRDWAGPSSSLVEPIHWVPPHGTTNVNNQSPTGLSLSIQVLFPSSAKPQFRWAEWLFLARATVGTSLYVSLCQLVR